MLRFNWRSQAVQMAIMTVILWVAYGVRFHQIGTEQGAFLSSLASVLIVAVTYALGKRLFDAGVGLLSAFFVALNSFSIYYAQQPQPYALLSLFAVVAMYAYVLFIERPNHAARIIGLLFVNSLGLYVHEAFLLVIVAQGVSFLIRLLNQRVLWQHAIPYLIVNIGTAILSIPLWLQSEQRDMIQSSVSVMQNQEALATILGYFAFGITTGAGLTIAVVFFLLFALIQLDNDPQPHQAWRSSLPFVWVMASIGVCLALGLLHQANFRLLLPAQIGFAIWLARGAWVLWHTEVNSPRPYASYIPKMASVLGVVYIGWTLLASLPALYHATLIIK
jgi:uncharacterized membrane protein